MKADEKEERKEKKMNDLSDKDKIIALQRKKIEELSSKVNALEEEIALLNMQLLAKNRSKKRARL